MSLQNLCTVIVNSYLCQSNFCVDDSSIISKLHRALHVYMCMHVDLVQPLDHFTY